MSKQLSRDWWKLMSRDQRLGTCFHAIKSATLNLKISSKATNEIEPSRSTCYATLGTTNWRRLAPQLDDMWQPSHKTIFSLSSPSFPTTTSFLLSSICWFFSSKNRAYHFQVEPKFPKSITSQPKLRFRFRQLLRIQKRKSCNPTPILPSKGSSFLMGYWVESFGFMRIVNNINCLN